MDPPLLLRALGPTLVSQGGVETPTNDVISGECGYLALYFTAEWAPNCRAITEQLIHLRQERGKDLQSVVLVSSDEDDRAFERQLEGMPWPAVPFSDIRRRLRLLRQYRVSNLPFLAVLNARTGRCVSRVTSDTLKRDPEGSRFPWKTRPLKDILTETQIVTPEGKSVPYEELKDGLKALYFSANWCPPCKAFTPQLIDTYNAVRTNEHKFEIIFVSSDRSEDSWRAYHKTMPWAGIKWSEEEVRQELAEALDVKGIPTLVILDSDLSVISRDGRNLVNEDPQAQGFPWRPQSVELLKDFHMPVILERPTLVLFTDGETSELQFGKEVLLPAAEEYYSDHSDDAGMSLKFYVAGEDEVSDGLRDLANLDDVVPLLTIIDLAEGSKYFLEKGVEISNATVHNFVTRYRNEELVCIPIDHEETDAVDEGDEEDEEEEEEDEEEIGENQAQKKEPSIAKCLNEMTIEDQKKEAAS